MKAAMLVAAIVWNASEKTVERGVPRVTPNDLRRTFATWFKQKDVDSVVVASMTPPDRNEKSPIPSRNRRSRLSIG
jgi:hypothetical protein